MDFSSCMRSVIAMLRKCRANPKILTEQHDHSATRCFIPDIAEHLTTPLTGAAVPYNGRPIR